MKRIDWVTANGRIVGVATKGYGQTHWTVQVGPNVTTADDTAAALTLMWALEPAGHANRIG